jgi:hypothetical protein
MPTGIAAAQRRIGRRPIADVFFVFGGAYADRHSRRATAYRPQAGSRMTKNIDKFCVSCES